MAALGQRGRLESLVLDLPGRPEARVGREPLGQPVWVQPGQRDLLAVQGRRDRLELGQRVRLEQLAPFLPGQLDRRDQPAQLDRRERLVHQEVWVQPDQQDRLEPPVLAVQER